MNDTNSSAMFDGLKDVLMNPDQGAAEMLQHAVQYLRTHPELLSIRNGDATLRMLRRTRPGIAPFAVLARRIENQWRRDPSQESSVILDQIEERIAEANRRAAKRLHRLFVPIQPVNILTLSNSSTVRFALEHAEGLIDKVYVLRSNPGGEGAGMVEALLPKIPGAELVEDDQLDDIATQVDVGVIGADSVFGDGVVLNKVLSVRLAERLHELEKPFYVIATSWKGTGRRSREQETLESDRFEKIPPSLITRVVSD